MRLRLVSTYAMQERASKVLPDAKPGEMLHFMLPTPKKETREKTCALLKCIFDESDEEIIERSNPGGQDSSVPDHPEYTQGRTLPRQPDTRDPGLHFSSHASPVGWRQSWAASSGPLSWPVRALQADSQRAALGPAAVQSGSRVLGVRPGWGLYCLQQTISRALVP